MKNTNQEMNPLHDLDPNDAIDMLVADHKRVANLFAEFKRLTDENQDDERSAIVANICQELTVHTQLEEELFYPAVRDAIDDEDQMDEAIVEHAGAKELIAQLKGADPEDDLYDAKVTVLGEQIDHHVEEEEGSMFPKARASALDTMALGAQMLARKAQIKDGAEPMTASISRRKESADDANEDEDEEGAVKQTKRSTAKKASKSTAKTLKKSR